MARDSRYNTVISIACPKCGSQTWHVDPTNDTASRDGGNHKVSEEALREAEAGDVSLKDTEWFRQGKSKEESFDSLPQFNTDR